MPLLWETIVMIKSISRGDIGRFLPQRPNIDRFIGAEVERFSDVRHLLQMHSVWEIPRCR